MKYELSYWEQQSFFTGIDIAVIGSGIVGLSAALRLKELEPHSRIVIFERGALPTGASTRNAGFACFGSMTELLDDLELMGEDAVLGIVEKRWRGLQRLRSLVGDANMDFQQLGGYELFNEQETPVFEACVEKIADFNEKIGRITKHPEVYKIVDDQLARFAFSGVKHLILNQAEGQVHTGKMMATLLSIAKQKGIEIFNGIDIKGLADGSNGVTLETAFEWSIQVPRVLVAVNGFAQKILPNLDVYPARNQVLLTKPIPGLNVEGCFHYDRGYFYFRNIDGRILLGGGRNLDLEGEKTPEFGSNERIRNALEKLLHEVVCPGREVVVDSWWTGILGLGPVKKPIVERVSPNVVVALRLSGMGVAIGTLIGQEGAVLLSAE